MPSSTEVRHNGRTLTFDEGPHTYTDDAGVRYTPVTALVAMGFGEFDAEAAAKAKAAREGSDWRKLMATWKADGERAARAGTRLHQNCERQILGQDRMLNQPESAQERLCFTLAFHEVKAIMDDSHIVRLEPEKLVFSPALRLAGSIDLLATCRGGEYVIYDWKLIRRLNVEAFGGRRGTLPATEAVPDSNYWHYALQLQIYEIILKAEGYIPTGANVRRVLNCVICQGGGYGRVERVELPDMRGPAKGLIKWLNGRR